MTNPKEAGQIWVAGEPKSPAVQLDRSHFPSLESIGEGGYEARVIYVQDAASGLKLFADKVWYVRSGEQLAAFLEKAKAEQWAESREET